MGKSCLPVGSASASFYTEHEKSFKNKQEALHYLGANLRCIGHIARARKTSGPLRFFRCRLYESDPPCDWVRMLRVENDGGATLWKSPGSGCNHNASSATVGVRGQASLEDRRAIEQHFEARAYVAPKEVYRTTRLRSISGAQLRDVQSIKKSLAR